LLDVSKESGRFEEHRKALAIKLSSPRQRAESLSGGNQQKLLVARWLEVDSQVIIFDEPTRGIDVGAKYEMYLLIRRLAAQGKVIILISSELTEILGMSDRILVMKAGRISGEITDVSSATQEQIMAMAV
jgi:ABC-type sugar transport system ATPase subunit